jgi:hypothetical protein
MASDHILTLSTTVEPAKKFAVDDEVYELLGMEHLSPEDEARATAAFSRFGQIARKLDRSTNDNEAKRLALALRGRRIELISMLTTIPREVAETLPLTAQIQLFNAIQEETGEELGDGGDGFD